jgi:pimeloyl-ACP methyl ester carboxylesterase
MYFERHGQGDDLLLLHGLGSSARSWAPLLPLLSPHRGLVVPDLPGFGRTPLPDAPLGIEVLADAVEAFLDAQGLRGIAACGHSMGGAVALELFRRGATGATVALAPGGFWLGWERGYTAGHVGMGLANTRAIQPLLPLIAALPPTRAVLFSLFSSRPWDIAPDLALDEALCEARSPGCDPMIAQILSGPLQKGLDRARPVPLSIGWGPLDRVTLVQQAPRALAAFPGATLHWLGQGGHYVHWDEPEAAARLILDTCGRVSLRDLAAAVAESDTTGSDAAGMVASDAGTPEAGASEAREPSEPRRSAA